MANDCFPNLVGAMDLLWFNHIILFSESIAEISLKTTKPISDTPLISQSSPNLSAPNPSEDEISSASSPTPSEMSLDPYPRRIIYKWKVMFNMILQLWVCDGVNMHEDPLMDDYFHNEAEESRLTRLNIATTKIRSQSSSPSVKKLPKRIRYSGGAGGEGRRSLRRTKSCKGLRELEYEELKGFIDLGFTFKKEQLTPRMKSVIPGLRRIEEYEGREEHQCVDAATKDDEIEVEREEERRGVMKPYLSEAWLIKRPDSPLLNLKIPRTSAAVDMKNHLRSWARTVAAVIQQES